MEQVKLSDFNEDEVGEITHYIIKNINASVLTQLLVMTDVPVDKAQIFVAMYRILNSARNYVENKELKAKLDSILKEVEKTYFELYSILVRYNNSKVIFNKHRLQQKIINILIVPENLISMNKFIDYFYVFAEKQQKYSINKITGIDLSIPEGQKLLNDIMSTDENQTI